MDRRPLHRTLNQTNTLPPKKQQQVNSAVIEDMVSFLNGNATGVAIFDSGSSNATHAKRADVMRRVRGLVRGTG